MGLRAVTGVHGVDERAQYTSLGGASGESDGGGG